MPRFRLAQTQAGFGIVPVESIVPHFDAIPAMFKPIVLALMGKLKDGERMIGVDEDTAIVGKPHEPWEVMGKAGAHVFTKDGGTSYTAGESFLLGSES